MSKTDDYLNTANALACVIGTVTADALVPGAGTALSGGASINYLRKRLFRHAPDLNRRLARLLDDALNRPTQALPPEAAILIPQMIERARLTPADIMADRRNAAAIATAMLGKLRDPDHKRLEIQAAFCAVVTPVLDSLLNDPTDNAALRPAFETATAETLGFIAEQVQVLTGQLKDTAEELGLTKGLILALARRIASDVEDVHSAFAELTRALDAAADLNRQAALPSNTGDAVDAVLDRVAELNAEERFEDAAAEIDRALAEAADQNDQLIARRMRLLDIGVEQDRVRGNPASAAARIAERLGLEYPDHAARFAALRKVQDDWYVRGLRFGLGFDLMASIDLAHACVDLAATPIERGMALNDLAIALQEQGIRSDGQADADLLGQAVTAFRDALTVRTRDQHPVDWAMTQNNLGNALQNQGIRSDGQAGADLLGQALTTYRDALTVRTRDQHSVDWAMTQENLAIVATVTAIHDTTIDPAPHLRSALDHVTAALTVFDPDHMPYNFNKAIKLRDQIRAALDGL